VIRLEHNGAHRTWFGDGEPPRSTVLLVGEDNPRSRDPRHALHFFPSSSAGGRLRAILGLARADWLNLWRVNLCVGRWDRAAARARALELLTDPDPPWQTVVMLGVKVAEACRYPHDLFTAAHAYQSRGGVAYDEAPGYVRRVDLGQFRAVSLPHPSGLNRVWNASRNWSRAQMLARAVAPDVAWGDQ
jgi:hypothetical protein